MSKVAISVIPKQVTEETQNIGQIHDANYAEALRFIESIPSEIHHLFLVRTEIYTDTEIEMYSIQEFLELAH